MTTTINQLLGMMYYEFVRHWRRRALPMTMALWLFVLFLGLYTFQATSPEIAGLPDDQEAYLISLSHTVAALTTIGGISTIFCVLTMGVMAAEIVPIDKQLGVMEWQEALPVKTAVYLTGKLLGIWLMALIGLLGVTAVSIPMVQWLVGSYDISAYLKLWLLILIPMTLIVSGITSLLGATFSSRRWAMFLGITLSIICYAYVLPSFINFLSTLYSDLILTDCVNQPQICQLFQANAPSLPSFGYPVGRIALIGLVALVVSWLVAWGWQQWQQQRR